MSKFLATTNRTVVWFKKANENGDLQMKPPFQRNPVWTHPQKSYLIDTILNGLPIPEIYMQEFVDESGNERHIIIDGQQRIRACLEFIEGGFAIGEEESPSHGDMKFDDLSPDDKKKVFAYTFIVRVLPDMSDEEIRGIFQRLNKNVVALNAQELRQATYWGPFLKTMQEISDYGYWSTTGIFTPLNIRRMMDVEYVSEIAVAVLHGHQNKKETLDKYYEQYEEEFEAKEDIESTFQAVIFELEQLYPDIKNTRWKKKSDFYSLFMLLQSKLPHLPLSSDRRLELRGILDEFTKEVNLYLSVENPSGNSQSEDAREYAKALRASSDIGNRKRRQTALENVTKDFFSKTVSAATLRRIEPRTEDLFTTTTSEEVTE